ncbi:hypothetical protein ACPPVU_10045 [Mucilaginibacter sp. McL0603]|uniref:hypothetical protein n=1 Tax=Mucilaginibacter sp. McL0603 TaxID=3415670 RepID=UPI003CE8FD53
MLTRIISGLLTLFVVYMGFKQGLAMVSAKPIMLDMFGKWHFSNTGIVAFGIITLLSALLILFPQTFTAGNILMAITILVIIGLQLSIKDVKGALIEVPFLLMNLVLIWLQYPLSK